jgi:hypothetical protein
MHLSREPRLDPVPILELRPTQMTVGYREVRAKRASWRTRKHRARFLGSHLVPVVRGPKERLYLIDHHHLARALHEAGVEHVAVTVVADLARLDRSAFFTFLDHRGWLHPYDARGRRCAWDDLPKDVAGLADDPFRSLAGELRRAGGFAKDTTPFSEFLWADFLRRRIPRDRVERRFAAALDDALQLARSGEADFLPGWCGPAAEG